MADPALSPLDFARPYGDLPDSNRITVAVGDLKAFVNDILSGVAAPALSYAYNGLEQTATCHRNPFGPDDPEEICDIKWVRADVTLACEHVYGITLDRDDDAVESMIDSVVERIGDNLQDRSTEYGFELIYQELPGRESVYRLLAQEADKLIREKRDDAYEIFYDDSVASEEPAFCVVASASDSERVAAEQPTAVFIEYAKDFTGSAYDLCDAAFGALNKVDALSEETVEAIRSGRSRLDPDLVIPSPSEVADAARTVARASSVGAEGNPAIRL